MTEALTPPFLVACLVLCVAGASKLRSPHVAAATLGALGLPARAWTVRLLAVGELALGAACAVDPSRAMVAVLAGAYAMFAGVAAALLGRRAPCGCFGGDAAPVTAGHVLLSAVLVAVAVASALAAPRGLSWLAGQPAGAGLALAVGVAGAAYGVVAVYTAVPRAWMAWGGE